MDSNSFVTPVRRPPTKRSRLSTPASTPSSAPSPAPLQIPASPLMSRLGYGTGVSVYLLPRSPAPTGNLRSPWAVKKINNKVGSQHLPTYEERLRLEADILKTLKHPNVVGYRGVSRSADGSLCLCMESGEQSLFQLIEDRQELGQGHFSAKEIMKVAFEVAKGLNFLHNKTKMLHGDIKSHNILIKGDFEQIKLCDFGVAVKLNASLSGLEDPDQNYVGSSSWSPIEALEDGTITDRADIFAYGCMLYEMLTLNIPHMPMLAECSDDDESFDEEAYTESLGSRPTLPASLHYDVSYTLALELFFLCTSEKAEKRPSAKMIVESFNSSKENI